MSTITTIIEQHQRGLLYRDGRLIEWLEPGRHRRWGWNAEWRVEVLDLTTGYYTLTPELRAVKPEDAGYEVVVGPDEVGVLLVDGEVSESLVAGRYILWQVRAEVRLVIYDTTEILAEMPTRHACILPAYMLQTYVIASDERGLLTVDGECVAWLDAGRHHVWSRDRDVSVRRLQLDQGYIATDFMPDVGKVMPPKAAVLLEVSKGELALLYREGRSFACLGPGSYLVWQLRREITHRVFGADELMTQIPERDWEVVPEYLMLRRTVRPYERGLLWVDGAFVAELGEGRYGVHLSGRDVELRVVDMREREIQIVGQEVMTADKVTLRLNLIVKFRVTDARKSIEVSDDLDAAMYSEAQLVARSTVAGQSLDELLESRGEAARQMRDELAPRATAWGVSMERIDLKDVILPGEMKTLLNRVIEAEKQAAANVIMRREETSATRAQANTAKMMENNPALMRLKELELLSEVSSNVGQLTIVTGGDDLVRMLNRSKEG